MSVEQKINIEIRLPVTREAFIASAKTAPIEAAKSLDGEIEAFDRLLASKGTDPLSNLERQMVREYLAYKILKAF